MSTGWENFKPAPLEYFHGKLMDAFHELRQRKDKANILLTLDGSEMNNMIAAIKNATYAEYPDHISHDAVPKASSPHMGEREEKDVSDIHVGDMPQKVPRWVKASERTPIEQKNKQIPIRFLDGCIYGSLFYDHQFHIFTEACGWRPIVSDIETLEWLEEAEAPAAQPTKPPVAGENQPITDSRQFIPAEALEKIEKCSECWNDEIRPHFYKAMCFGYLLAIGKLSSYHWTALDPPPGHQPTETPALGESSQKSRQCGHCGTMHYRDTEGSMPAICCNCHNPLIWPPGSVREEAVPVQQGEVPEQIRHRVDTVSDAYGRTNIYSFPWPASEDFDPVTNQSVPYKDGAIAMYHRDQDEIDCLKSEIMGYKKIYSLAIQEKNAADKHIKALQSQVSDYYNALSDIFDELSKEGKDLVASILDKHRPG